jgi:WhiB family redox-sensing transcriptional regulator
MSGNISWRDEAACRGMDTNLFFDRSGGIFNVLRRTCEKCPVQEQCLDEALSFDWGEQHGFVGGLSRNARRAIITKRDQQGATL